MEDAFKTVQQFKSYVNKPEITNLSPQFLVKNSKNVLIDYANRIISRNGYVLYGAAASVGSTGIKSSYEWDTSTAKQYPLRVWGSLIEFYYNSTWNTLKSGLATPYLEFAKVWDNTEKIDVLLWVMGDTNFYKWSGGVTKIASTSGTTLTKQGVLTAKTTIAFVAGTTGTVAPTITDSANGFITAGFTAGDTLYVTGSTANSRNFTIGSVTAGTITLIMTDVLTSEVAGPSITVHNGEPTWASSRFFITDTNTIIYNGTEYTYTGGATTDTLTGLTAFPSITIGDPVWQKVVTIANTIGVGTTLIKNKPTITIATPAVITSVAHGLALNDVVYFTQNVITSGTVATTSVLPTGITAGTAYYVIAAGLTADAFEISTSLGGAAVNTSGSQSGTFSLYKSVPTSYKADLIATQLNQVILASTKSQEVYVSSNSDYTNFVLTSPRAPADPAKITMDNFATCLTPIDNDAQTTSSLMIGAGVNEFFQLTYQLSQDNSTELVRIIKLKTASGSGIVSRDAIGNIKNSVAYITHEPTLDTLDRLQSVNSNPLSDPVKNDFDIYNFTGAHLKYWKRALYIALPSSGVVLIYDLQRKLWQPPQTMPISRLAIIGDWLYGHSSVSNESYKLFVGTNDNGNFIPQVARFAYNNGGNRSLLKNANMLWSDGYLTPNAMLYMNFYAGFEGVAGKKVMTINGGDISITNPVGGSPLGDEPLGATPIGGDNLDAVTGLPGTNATMLRFYQDDTMSVVDHIENFVEFTMNTLDAQFALVSYGSNLFSCGTSHILHKK